jgi:CubicO group peptidase (beta-lactamase class C family)
MTRIRPTAAIATTEGNWEDASIPWPRATSDEQMTLVRAGSLSKLVVALVALRLADRGLVDLDRDIREHLYFMETSHSVTLAQLLSHTGGAPAYALSSDWPMLVTVVGLGESQVKGSVASIGRSGNDWMYSSYGIVAAAAILAVSQGVSFRELAFEEVFRPLAMSTARIGSGKPSRGFEVIAGMRLPVPRIAPAASPSSGLVASVADVAALGRALVSKDYLSSQSIGRVINPIHSDWGIVPFSALTMRLQWAGAQPWAWHGGQHLGFSHFLGVHPSPPRAILISSNTRIRRDPLRPAARTWLASIDPLVECSNAGGPGDHAVPTGSWRLRWASSGRGTQLRSIVMGAHLRLDLGNGGWSVHRNDRVIERGRCVLRQGLGIALLRHDGVPAGWFRQRPIPTAFWEHPGGIMIGEEVRQSGSRA